MLRNFFERRWPEATKWSDWRFKIMKLLTITELKAMQAACRKLIKGYEGDGLNDCPLCQTHQKLYNPDLERSIKLHQCCPCGCALCPWVYFAGNPCETVNNYIGFARCRPKDEFNQQIVRERLVQLQNWVRMIDDLIIYKRAEREAAYGARNQSKT